MNSKLVTIFVAGFAVTLGGSIVYAVVRGDAECNKEKAAEDILRKKAEALRSEEDTKAMERSAKAATATCDIFRNEQKRMDTLFNEWKKEERYDEQVRECRKKHSDAVQNFCKEHRIEERIRDVERSMNQDISDYRRSISYDEKINQLKKDISAAQSQYEAQTAVAKTVGKMNEKFEDGANDIQKAAKKAMDEAVTAKKAEIKAIEDDFNKYKAEVIKKKHELIAVINDEKNKGVKQFDDECSKTLGELAQKKAEAFAGIRSSIKSERSAEDEAVIADFRALKDQIADISDREEEFVKTNLSEMSDKEKIAAALVSHNVSPGLYAFLGLMPAAMVEIFVLKYVTKVFETVKYMKKLKSDT